ncbi:hypothetical protein ACQKWADRAFT_88283 [Trichoderma austrokoningii]
MNNCQHFCYLVLRNLNWNYPDQVPKTAIDGIARSATSLITLRKSYDALKRLDPYPYPKSKDDVWWREAVSHGARVKQYWDGQRWVTLVAAQESRTERPRFSIE